MLNVFFMMGQSNMAGRGALGELPDIDNSHVFVLRNGEWEHAVEPVVRDKVIAGVGMGTAFGNVLNMLTGADIGLLPCALGGSPLAEWQPGCRLFEDALKQAEDALKSGAYIAGLLWHQGETDAENAQNAYTYTERFVCMRDEFLQRLSSIASGLGLEDRVAQPLPVVVGELGDYLDDFPQSRFHSEINRQLRALGTAAPQYACVSVHGLSDKGDKLHFSAASQRMLGLRYACAWLEAAHRAGVELK